MLTEITTARINTIESLETGLILWVIIQLFFCLSQAGIKILPIHETIEFMVLKEEVPRVTLRYHYIINYF